MLFSVVAMVRKLESHSIALLLHDLAERDVLRCKYIIQRSPAILGIVSYRSQSHQVLKHVWVCDCGRRRQ